MLNSSRVCIGFNNIIFSKIQIVTCVAQWIACRFCELRFMSSIPTSPIYHPYFAKNYRFFKLYVLMYFIQKPPVKNGQFIVVSSSHMFKTLDMMAKVLENIIGLKLKF